MKNWIGILVSYLAIFLVIVIAKLFEKLGKEASRKFIHIALGNWWLIAMYFFDNIWFALFVPATFIVINYISYKKNLIKVMERTEDEKEGLGTVYYAMSLFIVTLISFSVHNTALGLAPIFVMAYGDGLAAVIGRSVKSPKYKIYDTEKSLAGSLTMFIVSFTIMSIYLGLTTNLWFIKSFLCSLIVTLLEAISIRGTDNFTVPIAAIAMLLVL